MKCDGLIEKIKTRVAAIDPNGERKVIGVFLFKITAEDGVHNLGKILKN